MKAIAAGRDQGLSLNQAIGEILPPSRRGWAIRHWMAYKRDGLEGLIDARLPREPKMTRACDDAVQVARLANPKVTIPEMLKILSDRKISPLPSASTLRRLFARVDDRRRYAEKKERKSAKEEIVDLPLAGGELILAAEAETNVISALVGEVARIGSEVVEASQGQTPTQDVGYRDAQGRFTAAYNHQRRRKPGEPIASYLRSAQEKAEGQVLSGLRFVHEQPETIEAKVRMLVFEPLINPTQGWDGLRAEGVAGLAPLTGYAYMPSTLSKFTSALSRCGAGPRLLQVLGDQCHQVAQEQWGEAGAMAALFIDNHAKEVWSSLYTRSGKVSHLNRVMPCITSTYIQSGAGTPLLVLVQSGAAPLAPRVVELVEQVEASLADGIERAVVIDSEGSTFDLLATFRERQRVIVTPLKPSRLSELELNYSPGSYFRPYRERDELRIAKAVLHHKTTNRSLELDALIVRREHRENDMILLTTGVSQGMSGRDLADLYYRRWPTQENFFKDGEAVRLAEHRGNCGTIVSNVVVVRNLERLEKQAIAATEKLRQLDEEKQVVEQIRQDREHAARQYGDCRRQLAELAADKETTWEALGDGLREHHEAEQRNHDCAHTLKKAEAKEAKNEARRAKVMEELDQITEKKKVLEPQKTIRQLDVALDSVLTATKLAAAFLITFVLREYFDFAAMTAGTFLARILSVRGRREIRSTEERIVFYENPRDPEINAALTKACERLNKRELQREGRRLRYGIEAPPDRPP